MDLIRPGASQDLPTRSIDSAIFSNSSGQISGQNVKPKYKRENSPSKFLLANAFPSGPTKVQGPPTAAFPLEGRFLEPG